MTFQTQRVAYPYFVVALLLFVLQVAMGLWVGLQYVITVPQAIVDVFPFATSRAMHTNLLVLWMLLGFMGATYYLVPEEAQAEIAWPKLAIFQLVLLVATGVAALVSGSSSDGPRAGRCSRSRPRSTSSWWWARSCSSPTSA
jgi:nitric oxide reductase subunit B